MKKQYTKEKRQAQIRDFFISHPNCTVLQIRKATKLKVERYYKNLKEAYLDAGVPLSKNLTKRNLEEHRKQVIELIKNSEECTVPDIERIGINIYRTFGSIKNAYLSAGVIYRKKEPKSGVIVPEIAQRAHNFEREVFDLLTNLGQVQRYVKTTEGTVDCLLHTVSASYAVEIKDYRAKNNVGLYEFRQLVRYMKALNLENGMIICPKCSLPKRKLRREIIINNCKIQLIAVEELRGRSTIHGSGYNLASIGGSSIGARSRKAMTSFAV